MELVRLVVNAHNLTSNNYMDLKSDIESDFEPLQYSEGGDV